LDKRARLNSVVLDSKWESSAAYHLEAHPRVIAFVKNQGLGFAIPYLHAAGGHEYVPDFLVRLDRGVTLILETKGGRDEIAEIKVQAAERWVAAVNADGLHGEWRYVICHDMNLIPTVLDELPGWKRDWSGRAAVRRVHTPGRLAPFGGASTRARRFRRTRR
jgi:type III restriction enzyme